MRVAHVRPLALCRWLPAILWLCLANRAWADDTSIFSPTSTNADSIANIFWLVLAITAVIFVVVVATIVTFLFRFRARPGDDTEPPQIYGSWPIEIAWTITPALIIFVLTLIVIRSVNEQKPRAGENAFEVRVIGHQWWWEIQYPGPDGETVFTTANELHLPLGPDGAPRSVFLELESADVIHSFWVPRLGGKTDLVPNRINTMWLEPSEAGLFLGQCAEYCGTQHGKMYLAAYVHETPADFETWFEKQRRDAVSDPAVADGRKLFLTLSCANCHTIRGTSADGRFGPDLTHLMSRATLASGAAENTAENLATWLKDPATFKIGCHMPDMHLDSQQVKLLVDYLTTLD